MTAEPVAEFAALGEAYLPHRRTVQAVADLLQLLRRGIHRILHALGLGLQRDELTVVGREVGLRGLQIVEQLGNARLQLTQRKRGERLTRFVVVIDVTQRIQRFRGLAHVLRRLRHLLTKLGGFCFNALNFINVFQRLCQILLGEFLLRRELFCLFRVSSCD